MFFGRNNGIMANYADIIVAGAGASGMIAAYYAAITNKSVILLDHNDKIGRKILLTGNGKCNLTNLKMNSECYCRENAEFAMKVISKFDEKDVMNFFTENGLLLHEKNGYVYPNANQAQAVNDFFGMLLKQNNITIFNKVNISDVCRKELFVLKTDKGDFSCRKLIIAAGSMAYPKTGSDGSFYNIVKKLGHKVVKPRPALTALQSDFSFLKDITGVRCDGNAELFIDDNCVYSERGEIQITDYGLSGIPIFQFSRYAVCAVDEKKHVSCRIDLLPDYTEKEILEFLHKRLSDNRCIGEAFAGMINRKLSDMIIRYSGFLGRECSTDFTDEKILKLIDSLKNLEFKITGYKGSDFGQVCQGGVSVDEISPDTMESLLVKDLYFAGEIVDVDGICGGYNLQWAWSSGYVAGKACADDSN